VKCIPRSRYEAGPGVSADILDLVFTAFQVPGERGIRNGPRIMAAPDGAMYRAKIGMFGRCVVEVYEPRAVPA